ncbi:hypothetical protein LINPERPRIM_LOCUS35412, partial [Linum perenne]
SLALFDPLSYSAPSPFHRRNLAQLACSLFSTPCSNLGFQLLWPVIFTAILRRTIVASSTTLPSIPLMSPFPTPTPTTSPTHVALLTPYGKSSSLILQPTHVPWLSFPEVKAHGTSRGMRVLHAGSTVRTSFGFCLVFAMCRLNSGWRPAPLRQILLLIWKELEEIMLVELLPVSKSRMRMRTLPITKSQVRFLLTKKKKNLLLCFFFFFYEDSS